MRRFFIVIFSVLAALPVFSQNIRFEINVLPAGHPAGSAVYIAGSFNGWKPDDEKYRFSTDVKGHYTLLVNWPAGSYEYKITRGGWDKVECQKDGHSVGNRQLKVEGDGQVELAVEAWQDSFKEVPRTSTASKQVQVLDTTFFIPQLNRKRRIWIYLPENYYSGPKNARWPVLYMNDGQNVFDNASSYAGEWGVDEFLDTALFRSCIVVAVDHGGDKRLNEYSPYDFSLRGFGDSSAALQKGEGTLYLDFLVKRLKPYIDKNFRTLGNKSNTFIAGSSMGGLISMYALLKYPKVFGGAGVFSPAFWIAPQLLKEVKAKGSKVKARIYFYAGKQESQNMVTDMLKVFEGMTIVSSSKIKTVIRDEGKHNEAAWRREFPLFYQWVICNQ